MKMNERCPVCGQPLDMEPGFYYGTNMISYGLAVLICIVTFFTWWLTIGFSLQDSRFFWWIGINGFLLLALQPPLMRISRTVCDAIKETITRLFGTNDSLTSKYLYTVFATVIAVAVVLVLARIAAKVGGEAVITREADLCTQALH